jgi:hypothetical protein
MAPETGDNTKTLLVCGTYIAVTVATATGVYFGSVKSLLEKLSPYIQYLLPSVTTNSEQVKLLIVETRMELQCA